MSRYSPSSLAILTVACRKLRLTIDSTTHSSLLSLYQSVPIMCPPKTPHENTHFGAFMRSDSPQPTLPRPEFVPMFTQADRIGGAKALDDMKPVHPSIPSFLSDLPSMLPESIVVDTEDEDLYKQHMVVVDGWRMFLTSLHCSNSKLYNHRLCRNNCAVFSLKHWYPVARLWYK